MMTEPEEAEGAVSAAELARHVAESLARLAGLLHDPRARDSLATFAAGLDELAKQAAQVAEVLTEEEAQAATMNEAGALLPWRELEDRAEGVAAAEVKAGGLSPAELMDALKLLGAEARANVEGDAGAGTPDASARGEAVTRGYARLLAALTMQQRMLDRMNQADALLSEPSFASKATSQDFPAAAQAMVSLCNYLATFRRSHPAAAFWRVMSAMGDVEKGWPPALMSVPRAGERKRQQSHEHTIRFLATAALQLRRLAHEAGAAGTLADHFRMVKDALPARFTLDMLKKWDDAARAGLRVDQAPPPSVSERMKQRQQTELARLARLLEPMKHQDAATLLRGAEEIEDRLRREWGNSSEARAKSAGFGLSRRDQQRRS